MSKFSTFSLPPNIRCSNRCANPVRPRGSFFEPTAVVDRHPDDRRLAVGVDDRRQAVRQREGLVRNVDFGDELGQRGGLGLLGLDRNAGSEGKGDRGCDNAE
jgi:hypothetical protein